MSDEIYHYGILGMKWGQRRFQKKNGSLTPAGKKRYTYETFTTRRYRKKAAKAEAKGKTAKATKYANRAKRSAEFDDKMSDLVSKKSTGEILIKNFLMTPVGHSSYAMQRAAGASRGKALVKNALLGPLAGARARSLYIKQDEKKRK